MPRRPKRSEADEARTRARTTFALWSYQANGVNGESDSGTVVSSCFDGFKLIMGFLSNETGHACFTP